MCSLGDENENNPQQVCVGGGTNTEGLAGLELIAWGSATAFSPFTSR